MSSRDAVDRHFADFVLSQTASLLRTAVLLTRSGPDAEELVQDTLAQLYRHWEKVMAADSPTAYARRSLVNRHLSDRRLNRLRLRSIGPIPGRRDIQDVDVAAAGRQIDFSVQLADRDHIRKLLAELPDRQRTAVVLRYFHDLDDAAVADAMGARIGTVRSLISRALTSLRRTALSGATDGPSSKERTS